MNVACILVLKQREKNKVITLTKETTMKSTSFCYFSSMEEQNENQLNIELSEEIAEGIYSNLAIITHSSSEFVLDFIRVMPGVPKAKVKSRIILTPEHAKRLLSALDENIEKFETLNGRIKIQQDPSGFPMNFGGTMGQA